MDVKYRLPNGTVVDSIDESVWQPVQDPSTEDLPPQYRLPDGTIVDSIDPNLYREKTLWDTAQEVVVDDLKTKALMGGNAFFALGKGLAGIGQAVGDYTGWDGLSQSSREIAQTANLAMRPELYGVDPQSTEGKYAPVIGRTAAGVGAVLAGPVAAATTLPTLGWGERYNDLTSQGATPGNAATAATIEAGVGTAANLVGLNYLAKSSAPLVSRLALAGVTNAGIGVGQQSLSNELTGMTTGKPLSPEDYNQSLLTAGITSGAQGAAVAAGLAPRRTDLPQVVDSFPVADLPPDPNLPMVRPEAAPPAPIQKSPILKEQNLLEGSFPDVVKAVKEATRNDPAQQAKFVEQIFPKPAPEPAPEYPVDIQVPEPTGARTPDFQAEMNQARLENEAKTVPAMQEAQAKIQAREADVAAMKEQIDNRGIVKRWGALKPPEAVAADETSLVQSEAHKQTARTEYVVPRNYERGAVDVGELADALRTGIRRLFYEDERILPSSTTKSDNYYGRNRIASWEAEGPKFLRKIANASEDQQFRVKIPGIGFVRKHMASGDRIKKNFPEATPFIDKLNDVAENHSIAIQMSRQELDPLLKLPEQEQTLIFDQLAKLRLASLKRFREEGKYIGNLPDVFWKTRGFSDAQIDAMKAWQRVSHGMMDMLGEAWKAKSEGLPDEARVNHLAAIDDFVAHAKALNYVPLDRQGSRYTIYAGEGEPIYMRFDSKRQALKALKELRSRGRLDAELREAKSQVRDGSEDLPSVLSRISDEFDSEKLVAKGRSVGNTSFARHLIEATGVEGFDKNLLNPMKDYIFGASKYAAITKAKPALDALLAKFPEGSDLRAEMATMRDDALYRGFGKMTQAYDSFLTLQYLAATGNPAVGNILQYDVYGPATMLKYVPAKKVLSIYGQTYADILSFYNMRTRGFIAKTPEDLKAALATFKPADPELKDALLRHYEAASFTNQVASDMSQDARAGRGVLDAATKGLRETTRIAMSPFSFSEATVKARSYISGWYVGREKGLSGAALEKFAGDFMQEVSFDYRVTNKPRLFRHTALGKLRGKFMMFTISNIDWIEKQYLGGNKKGIALALGAVTALGGPQATPILKDLLGAAEQLGYDWKQALNDYFKKSPWISQTLQRGPLINVGLDNNSIMGSGSLLPPVKNSFLGAVSVAGGVPTQPLVQTVKSINILNDYDNPWGALKQIAPRGARTAMNLYEAATTGSLKDARRAPIVKDITPLEYAQIALGGYPARYSQEYQKLMSAQKESNNFREDSSGFNERFASALMAKRAGDIEEFQRLRKNLREDIARYNKKYGVEWEADDAQVDLFMRRQQDPASYEYSKAPAALKSRIKEILR